MALRPTPFVCPGCGMAIEAGEDFVVAREYEVAGDFALHASARDLPIHAERRFHVEHFRGRIDDYVYELVYHEAPR